MSTYDLNPKNGDIHKAGPGCPAHGCRPIVVLDPEDEEQVARLERAVKVAINQSPLGLMTNGMFATALRSLIAPPKPDEPFALGAVVEDSEGVSWVRWNTDNAAAPWRRQWNEPDGSAVHKDYSSIGVVKVLAEGVPA